MNAATQLVSRLTEYIINPAILVVFALGFFLFLWGLVKFLWQIGQGGEASDGKNHMVWGIVGMLVMVSVYGIISLISGTFHLDFGNPDMSRLNNVSAPANFFGK